MLSLISHELLIDNDKHIILIYLLHTERDFRDGLVNISGESAVLGFLQELLNLREPRWHFLSVRRGGASNAAEADSTLCDCCVSEGPTDTSQSGQRNWRRKRSRIEDSSQNYVCCGSHYRHFFFCLFFELQKQT